jgi:hypothetical protein
VRGIIYFSRLKMEWQRGPFSKTQIIPFMEEFRNLEELKRKLVEPLSDRIRGFDELNRRENLEGHLYYGICKAADVLMKGLIPAYLQGEGPNIIYYTIDDKCKKYEHRIIEALKETQITSHRIAEYIKGRAELSDDLSDAEAELDDIVSYFTELTGFKFMVGLPGSKIIGLYFPHEFCRFEEPSRN